MRFPIPCLVCPPLPPFLAPFVFPLQPCCFAAEACCVLAVIRLQGAFRVAFAVDPAGSSASTRGVPTRIKALCTLHSERNSFSRVWGSSLVVILRQYSSVFS
eukprot:TRINITY_DN10140_c0_g1_i1.p2 TRINITY_DN10140_c0_g1~~TRINITY_DN10140_c0_g1_i1.p2  ORF type:complete len:102 (+),score=3.38 TRINITY_DN10140_c0_g1_i1:121-426(+)